MIHAELRFPSRHLGQRVAMNVLLPETGEGPLATLYLLHGLSDDHTMWSRLGDVEAAAWNLPIAIVMPQGFRGWYTRNERGPDYLGYVVDDVVGTAERLLPLRRDRGGRCIGGLSMGGYGALRVGLGRPELFASIHSHSGAVLYGTSGRRPDSPVSDIEYANIFGGSPAGTDHDLLHLARRAAASPGPPPKLLIDCGVDDALIDSNRRLHDALLEMKLPHVYREHAGAHTWDYWSTHIRDALAFHGDAMGLAPIA